MSVPHSSAPPQAPETPACPCELGPATSWELRPAGAAHRRLLSVSGAKCETRAICPLVSEDQGSRRGGGVRTCGSWDRRRHAPCARVCAGRPGSVLPLQTAHMVLEVSQFQTLSICPRSRQGAKLILNAGCKFLAEMPPRCMNSFCVPCSRSGWFRGPALDSGFISQR